jgi:putative heme-binding domain-containing protein
LQPKTVTMNKIVRIFLLGVCLGLPLLTFCQPKKTQSVRKGVFSPSEEMAGFKLAPGFVVELVASERDSIFNPIDLTFDDAGRLWTQTARMYPLDPVSDIQWSDLLKLMDDQDAQKKHPAFKRILDLYQGKTRGKDKIIILSDLYKKGPVKSHVWADGLTIPMSVLPYKDGAYVAQGSEIFFLDDQNHDGKADERTPLFTGFGFTDTHTMAHVLVRAPGEWIHFSHGALNKGEVTSFKSDAHLKVDFSKIVRMSNDATRIELVSNGLNNIWGFQLRGNGQWYGSEANDLGYSVTPIEPGSGFPGIGNERLRPYQPFVPELHEFRVGGTGISGTAFADDESGSFPAEYKDVAFLANPITSTINAVKVIRNTDGSITAKHLPDLLTSEDDWFRPVNMEFGPDGCLYIADWYNKIVSHNELPTTHPDRDKTHGRIWRIRHVSQKSRPIPDLTKIATTDLPNHLRSPSLWEKRAAWHQITDRSSSETTVLIPELKKIAQNNAESETTRIHALWSLENLKHADISLIWQLLNSDQPDLVRETTRALIRFTLSPADLARLLRPLAENSNPAIRAQVLRTIMESGKADKDIIDLLVRACKPDLPGNAMGGSYERKFERFLARKALEEYPSELQSYLDLALPNDLPVRNILWAIEALPAAQKEAAFLKFWPLAKIQTLDEPTFISIAGMLKNKEIRDMVSPTINEAANAATYVGYALKNQGQIQSEQLGTLLQTPVINLLNSDVIAQTDLAIDAAGRFGMTAVIDRIAPLINEKSSDATLRLAIKALEKAAKPDQALLIRLAENPRSGFSVRAEALVSLSKVNADAAQNVLKKWLSILDAAEKRELVTLLSRSPQGPSMLLTLYESKEVDVSSFDLPAAERILNTNKNDPRAVTIMSEANKVELTKKAAFKTKLEHYSAVAQRKAGNAKAGEVLFQTCLSCHQVKGKGQTIAPSLDGSASREHEALLTAILDPDAAVESGYAVYRVTKKDGSVIEGYLVSQDKKGTTLAFMGGGKLFIETAVIQRQGFLGGRSFMIKGLLDNYSDQQVADLLAYIRTIK